MIKRIQFVTRYKGGGGGTTTTPTIPDWAAPYIQRVGSETESQYNKGNLGKVASASDLQTKAFTTGANAIESATTGGMNTLQAQQARLSNMATTPSAETLEAQKADVLYNAQKGVAGLNTGFGGAGTLGSARQAVMQGAQNADTTGKLAQVNADYENKMFQNRLAAEQALGTSVGGAGNLAAGGASALANLGGQQRTIDQQQQDADWQALNRYASTIYGNPARQQTTVTPGGK
jgi:hypothetical protein